MRGLRSGPDVPAAAALLLLLLAGACSSTSTGLAGRGGPDSMGIVVVDCGMRFETTGDSRRYDQYLTFGLDRLGQAQAAQSAFYAAVDDPRHEVAAKPTRGLLLFGPLRAGTYHLKRVGLEREFLDTNQRQGFEFIREAVTFTPGSAGTSRIAFVVEPGGVTYVGRMVASCVLSSPEADFAVPEVSNTDLKADRSVPSTDVGQTSGNLRRVRWIADDRTWSVDWDRDIRHEISAWERVTVALRETAWAGPIARRLEFLKTQRP